MRTLTNGEDPDEIPHNVSFHLCLHCLLGLKDLSEKEIQFNLEIITSYPRYIQLTKPNDCTKQEGRIGSKTRSEGGSSPETSPYKLSP